MKYKEKRWVITDNDILFTGQYLTRKDAIDEHVSALGLRSGNILMDISSEGRSVKQRAWRQWYRKGHRAVKIEIRW